MLSDAIATRGPYVAVVCRISPLPFQPFDAELFRPFLPHLRVVASAQRGVDDFDVDWLTRHGIWFANTRHSTGEPTADMAVFLILAVLRDTRRAEKSFRAGHWRGDLPLAKDPSSMTLGIVGMGDIGGSTARKAAGLGMPIRYYTRGGKCTALAPRGAVACATLEELLQTSDVVSLHCPLTSDTFHLIGRRELGLMKHGGYLINTSRGAVVDSAALIDALEEGQLTRAGLDVFEHEPTGIDPYFLSSERVVCQPHMGGLTEQAFLSTEHECLTNIRTYLLDGRPAAPFNTIDVAAAETPMPKVTSRDVQSLHAASSEPLVLKAETVIKVSI